MISAAILSFFVAFFLPRLQVPQRQGQHCHPTPYLLFPSAWQLVSAQCMFVEWLNDLSPHWCWKAGRAQGSPGALLFSTNHTNVKESPLGSSIGARLASSRAWKTPKDNPVQFVYASNEETKNRKEDRDCLKSHGAAEGWLGLGAIGLDTQHSLHWPTLSWSGRPRPVGSWFS